MLADPSGAERELLGAFRYSRNLAVLHTDESFMPKRRAVWSSWNYLGSAHAARDGVCVTYWMNRLQNIATEVAAVRHPQSAAAAARRNAAPQRGLRASDVRCEGHGRAAAAVAAAGQATTPGSAAPISAQASTKTACRRASRSPSNSAACGGPGSAERIRPYRADGADRSAMPGIADMTCDRRSMSVRSCTGGCVRACINSAIARSGCCSISTNCRRLSAQAAAVLPQAVPICSASTTPIMATARRRRFALQVERSCARLESTLDGGGSGCSACRARSAIASIRSASTSATARTARSPR